MIVIESRNLVKSYGKIKALAELSFAIEENKITGLIGRNGAGKTTLLKVITGLFKPDRGEIQVYEQNPFNSLAVSANLIFIDDQMAFPPSFTLADILAEMPGFYANFDRQLAQGLLEYFSLNPNQRHHKLSKGTKSTFNSIIGLAAHCPLTLFDEPTTGMDSAVRKDFYRALLKDYLEYPRTIVLSSHLLGEIEDILEDILLLDAGTKCLHLPVSEFKEYAVGLRGKTQEVEAFVKDKEIIHKEEFTREILYAALKNNFPSEQLDRARQKGIEVLPVTTEDICAYLTAGSKGGIDDVFNRS